MLIYVAFNFDYFYKNNVGKNKFYNEERTLEITDIKKYFYNYLEKPIKIYYLQHVGVNYIKQNY